MDERPEYEALLSATRDIVAVLDDSGTIEYVNPAAERIVGHEPAALVGDTDITQLQHGSGLGLWLVA